MRVIVGAVGGVRILVAGGRGRICKMANVRRAIECNNCGIVRNYARLVRNVMPLSANNFTRMKYKAVTVRGAVRCGYGGSTAGAL